MATTVENSCRYRINVSQTSTGKKSWDCTVDMEGETMQDVLEWSDKMVKALEARYPPEPEKKPTKETGKPPQHEGLGTPEQETPPRAKSKARESKE